MAMGGRQLASRRRMLQIACQSRVFENTLLGGKKKWKWDCRRVVRNLPDAAP
jgi:hypothetical protein